jgi:hypothetical protein
MFLFYWQDGEKHLVRRLTLEIERDCFNVIPKSKRQFMQWKESASSTANKFAVTKSKMNAYLSVLLHHDPVSFAFITQRQTVNQDSYVDVLAGIKANLKVGISEFRLSNLFL